MALELNKQTGDSFGASDIDTIEAFVNELETTLALKANIASPAFTGVPTAPTAAAATNTTQLATTAFVQAAISSLVDAAPAALNTLNELAAALGDDANFASTMTTALAAKANLASPALTGTPTAPTAAEGTNTTQIATTAFIATALNTAQAAVVPNVRTITINGVTQDLSADRSFTVAGTADTQGALTYSATTNIDFNAADVVLTLALTGNVTLTAGNMAAAKQKIIIITADASARTLTFPAGWKFIGDARPTSIAASKTGVLTLYCTGATEASVLATYSVEL